MLKLLLSLCVLVVVVPEITFGSPAPCTHGICPWPPRYQRRSGAMQYGHQDQERSGAIQNGDHDKESAAVTEDDGWCKYIDIENCIGAVLTKCPMKCSSTKKTEEDCPAGFTDLSGRCYLFSQKMGMARRTQEEARLYCIVLGGDLATAGHGGASDADPLLKYVHRNDLAGFGLWLGATQKNGVITWFDGRDFSRDSYLWYRSEPQRNNQKCVAVNSVWKDNDYNRHYIADWDCTSSYHFVCEKEKDD